MGTIKAAQRCVSLLRVPWLVVRELESKPSTLPLGIALGCSGQLQNGHSPLSASKQNEKVGPTRKLAADSDTLSKVRDRDMPYDLPSEMKSPGHWSTGTRPEVLRTLTLHCLDRL